MRLVALALLCLLQAPRLGAVAQIRNVWAEPAFFCPGSGQSVTVHFEASKATAGLMAFGVLSQDSSIQLASDYGFMYDSFTSGTGACPATLLNPIETWRGFVTLNSGSATTFQPYSQVFCLPAAMAGWSTVHVLIRLADAWSANALSAGDLSYDLPVEVSCTKKLTQNRANFWYANTNTVNVVIDNGCASTPSRTPTFTATLTRTPTPSVTATPTFTFTQTLSATPSFTRTASPTLTVTPSSTLSNSPTPTLTRTPTSSATPTSTVTLTVSPGPSATYTATRTSTTTSSSTYTSTPTFTVTSTPSVTLTVTPTFSSTSSITPGPSPTDTATRSSTPTPSATSTLTSTPTSTLSFSSTSTPPGTLTDTPTRTETSLPTASFSPSASPSATLTPTATPTSTYSPSITPTSSATPTAVPQPFQLVIKAYNSAGEEVKTLYAGGIEIQPQSLKLSSANALQGSGFFLSFEGSLQNGSKTLLWGLDNDSGQLLASGVYLLKAEIKDRFGAIQSLTASLQILPAQGPSCLRIFNSAGEEVWQSCGGGWQEVDLPSKNFAAGHKLSIQGRDAQGASLSQDWDGKNSQGAYVAPGSYQLLLQFSSGKSMARSFTVLKAATDSELSSALVIGSPWRGQGSLQLRFAQPLSAALSLKLFTLNGELAGQAACDAGSTTLVLDPSRLAAGIYVAVLDLHSASRERKTLRLAVLR